VQRLVKIKKNQKLNRKDQNKGSIDLEKRCQG